jgi:murein DD-endopeptidase MepM/ murein hydrolase activator NlpD
VVQPNLAGSNDEVGQELAEAATAQMQLDRLYLPLADTKIQNNFALSTKSKTLGDWRSHLAVDFAVQNGAEVLAVATGTVSKILTNDPYWGTVITLDHGGGWSTSYSNINSPTIRVGARVGARQPIGQVTENPPLELLDALHLHFVLLQNGQPMDPNSKWNE